VANRAAVTSTSPALTAPFVIADAARLGTALLVRPTLRIETLEPLQSEPGSIYDRALEQFDGLVGDLSYRGVRTVVVGAEPSQPAAVMVADHAVVLRDGAVLMRPTDPGRRAETARIEQALAAASVPIIGRIEPPGILDGGDVLVGSDAAYVGVTYERASVVGLPRARRGNELGRSQFAAIAQSAGLGTVEVRIASDARRLRAVASFIDRKTVLLAPDLVDRTAFAGLESIDVPLGEAYSAGVLVLGERRVIANVRFVSLFSVLRRARCSVEALDLWEFGKFGATPSMLALALKRS
jgi:dimethylargininase